MENSVAITMPYKYLQKFIAKHPIILLIYIYIEVQQFHCITLGELYKVKTFFL